MFRHEDFGGQLVWALERGVVMDTEGPKETFFNQPPPAAAAVPPAAGAGAGAAGAGAAAATDQAKQQQQQQQQQQGVGGKSKMVWKSFHRSSKTSWLMVGTISMLTITCCSRSSSHGR